MRILIVSNCNLERVEGGDVLRVVGLTRALASFHEVHLIGSGEKPASELAKISCKLVRRNNLFESILNVIHAVARPWLPVQLFLFRNRRIEGEIRDASENYDVIIFHLIRCYPYLPLVKAPVYIDFTDSIAMNYYSITRPRTLKQFFFLSERSRLKRAELKLANKQSVHPIFISKRDVQFLQLHNALIIKNGVRPRCKKTYRGVFPYDALFLGNFESSANSDALVWLVERVLPKVFHQVPNFRLLIVGRLPKSLRRITNKPQITYGGVVEDVALLQGKAKLGLCPVQHGAGLQNKVLDYIRLGCFPVSTSIGLGGATSLLKILNGYDDARQFSNEMVHRLVKDSSDEIEALNQILDQEYSWTDCIQPLLESLSERYD